MGLDVIMLGGEGLTEAQKEGDAAAIVLVNYLVNNLPDGVKEIDLGEPEELLGFGQRVGSYSALHVLRGLAVAVDRLGHGADVLTEEDFAEAIGEFYELGKIETGFPHLLHHSDTEGYYVPFTLPGPMTVTGAVKHQDGEHEEVAVSVGSSPALLAELDRLAPHLGLTQDMGHLGEEAFDELAAAHRWPTAAWVWGVLHWYARESTRGVTFVQFC
jgi:hypothetical protein